MLADISNFEVIYFINQLTNFNVYVNDTASKTYHMTNQ